jgi:hypothetical protein
VGVQVERRVPRGIEHTSEPGERRRGRVERGRRRRGRERRRGERPGRRRSEREAAADAGVDASSYRTSLRTCWNDPTCPRALAIAHGGAWEGYDVVSSNVLVPAGIPARMQVNQARAVTPP